MNKPKIVVILGPTASGKTGLALEVAKLFNGEVISADSRTVYAQMDIGTAKPSLQSIQDLVCGGWSHAGVLHWGFNLVNPDEHFQALDFKKFAEHKISDIVCRKKTPVIAGGTGLYIQGLVDNFDFEGGVAGEPKYNALQIGIFIDRAELYVRINKRVETMIASGLVSEVSGLKKKYGCRIKSMTGIGYRQICQYLEGRVNLKEAIEMIKRDTRRYSKRQMTWFKRDRRIIWVSNLNEAVVAIEKFLNKKTP